MHAAITILILCKYVYFELFLSGLKKKTKKITFIVPVGTIVVERSLSEISSLTCAVIVAGIVLLYSITEPNFTCTTVTKTN